MRETQVHELSPEYTVVCPSHWLTFEIMEIGLKLILMQMSITAKKLIFSFLRLSSHLKCHSIQPLYYLFTQYINVIQYSQYSTYFWAMHYSFRLP